MAEGAEGDDVATDTRAIVEAVCDRIIGGESIAAIFREPGEGYPHFTTFWRWLRKSPELDKLVADAQLVACRAMEDRLLDVTSEPREGVIVTDSEKDGRTVKRIDMVDRSRLEADGIKWVLARRYPKRYGDRVTLAGDADNPLAIDVVDAREALLRGLAPKPAGDGAPSASGGADE